MRCLNKDEQIHTGGRIRHVRLFRRNLFIGSCYGNGANAPGNAFSRQGMRAN